MYNFEPRIPVDHVVTLIGILRGTVEKERGDVLMLCGATLGEAGALLKQGLMVTMVTVEDVEAQIVQLEAHIAAEPNFDITPWIPILMEIIRLIMKNRS